MNIEQEVSRRRTFAIIAHPDAGKTTLTEKLLLFGGAINLAGAVKARGEQRRARSDWMKVEKERGISVVSSVMTYEYEGNIFNLLDTPGHEDFSEDTYRVLSAVDSAVMVIDAAKGIESQTRKLFEVCRLRDIPIITFINKMDREARDTFEILDEIEQALAISVVPASIPIGMGRDFKGCYDLLKQQLLLVGKSVSEKSTEITVCNGIDDKILSEKLSETELSKLREDVQMAQELCPEFDLQSYLEGHLTPVYFGSALNSFGVKELLDGINAYAPFPRLSPTKSREIQPTEETVSGFIFKIQANMDPKHRDRIAFMRLCSGHFKKGMKLLHVRENKQMAIHNPMMFFAQDRELANDAYAGDILGIANHGNLRIGDSLTSGEKVQFTGIPTFAPEYLQKVRPKDPLKAKHLSNALIQIAQEGGASVFKLELGNEWIVGAVGPLQFDVLADRIRTEYDIPVILESTSYITARWISGDGIDMKKFIEENRATIAQDHDKQTVFLVRNHWLLNRTQEDYPKISFLKTREQIF